MLPMTFNSSRMKPRRSHGASHLSLSDSDQSMKGNYHVSRKKDLEPKVILAVSDHYREVFDFCTYLLTSTPGHCSDYLEHNFKRKAKYLQVQTDISIFKHFDPTLIISFVVSSRIACDTSSIL